MISSPSRTARWGNCAAISVLFTSLPEAAAAPVHGQPRRWFLKSPRPTAPNLPRKGPDLNRNLKKTGLRKKKYGRRRLQSREPLLKNQRSTKKYRLPHRVRQRKK